MSLRAAAALAITANCLSLCGQYVISAKSGLINYVEGEVLLNGQPVTNHSGHPVEMQEASELRTAAGRAEVLLNPGVFLRLGENSAVRMVSNRLADARIEFVSGSAMIAPAGRLNDKANWAASVSIVCQETTVHLRTNGIFRFDTEPAQLRVYAGEASITLGARTRLVGSGEQIALTNPDIPQEFDRSLTDSLSLWTGRRTEYISRADALAARHGKDSTTASGGVWPHARIPLLSH